MREIATILSNMDDVKEIETFFDSLLTERERRDLGSRWRLVKLLHQGMSQREIAGRLRISLCKITRGSKELKKRRSIFKRIIEEGLDEPA